MRSYCTQLHGWLTWEKISHAEEIFILYVDQGFDDHQGKVEAKLPLSCLSNFT